MSTASDTSTDTPAQPFGIFDLKLLRRTRLTPHMVRATFTGPDAARIADNGLDQRCKLIFPAPNGLPLKDFPRGPDWYARWGEQGDGRAILRTYTIVSARHEVAEVDIDMVDHGDTGPGSTFAGSAPLGSEILLLGPVHGANHGVATGIEFRSDVAASAAQLLVGDETALPAIANILAALDSSVRGLACIEVESAAEQQDLTAPAGVEVRWCDRAQGRGVAQAEIVREWLTAHPEVLGADAGETVRFDHSDADAYWEVSQTPTDSGTAPTTALSAWIASESSVVKQLRRMLVNDFAVPKSAVAFMGYWKSGVAIG